MNADTQLGARSRNECRRALDGVRVIRVAKYLERIADHATNVAEQVIFIVAGHDVRHLTDPPPIGPR